MDAAQRCWGALRHCWNIQESQCPKQIRGKLGQAFDITNRKVKAAYENVNTEYKVKTMITEKNILSVPKKMCLPKQMNK